MNRLFLAVSFLILGIPVLAQGWKVDWSVSGHMSAGSGQYLPFWQRTVEGGYMPHTSSGVITAGTDISFDGNKGFFFDAGANLVGSLALKSQYNDRISSVLIDRLYVSGGWKMLHMDVGLKPRNRELSDLSISGGNYALSGYARNFPGINLWSDWIYFERGHWVGIKGNFAHYQLNDIRQTWDAMIHNKSLAVKFGFRGIVELEAGLDHWAQWGGVSSTLGDRPESFKDFIRVMVGGNGGDDATKSDQLNALGNHLGREYVRLNWNASLFKLKLQYDMPFDDGENIIQTQTFPDGIWTIDFSFDKRNGIVTDVLYEYIHTTWQSGDTHDRVATHEEMTHDYGKYVYWQDPKHFYYGRIVEGGKDDYFNNGDYRSGWTYFGKTIGMPLIVPAAPDSEGITIGVVNNRIRAHHFGLKGVICKIPYRFRATYSSNWGRYVDKADSFFANKPRQLSLALEAELTQQITKLPVRFAVGAYCDWGQLYQDSVGISLRIFYNDSHKW